MQSYVGQQTRARKIQGELIVERPPGADSLAGWLPYEPASAMARFAHEGNAMAATQTFGQPAAGRADGSVLAAERPAAGRAPLCARG